MRALVATLLALWALLIAPNLCIAGMSLCACECETCCHETGCEDPVPAHHTCPIDPCDTVVVKQTSRSLETEDVVKLTIAAVTGDAALPVPLTLCGLLPSPGDGNDSRASRGTPQFLPLLI